MATHSLPHWLFPGESNNQRARILHPTGMATIIAVYVVFQFLVRQFSATFPQILGFASQIPPQEIITLTNQERTQRGLATLTLDASLSAAAASKAADMFAKNYWAHVSPIGTQPWLFMTEAGYSYRYAGENLARDFSDPHSVVAAWLASPSHRENLLSGRYQDIGVAVVDGTIDGHDTTLVVQMFGTRLSASAPAQIGSTTSFTVQAAAPTSIPVPPTHIALPAPRTSLFSPFDLTRYFTFGLLGLIALVLAVDLIVVHSRGLARWTSKSLAHFLFVVMLLVAATAVIGGRII